MQSTNEKLITYDDAPKALTKKLAAVVSEKIETGVAMNAVAHMSLGLGALLGSEETMMCDYVDGSGVSHPFISAYPFIVLKGRPNKIREAIEAAKLKNVQVIDFTNTMTVGSYTEQLVRSKSTLNQDLEFYGAAFYGDAADVGEITKKFSLFK